MSSLNSFIRAAFFALLLGIALNTIGCYTLRHRLSEGFGDRKGIIVPEFTNTTDEIGAERIFTNAVIRELQSRGEVVVTSRHEANYELFGEVRSITYNPTALSIAGYRGLQSYRRLPTDLQVNATVFLRLFDLKKKTSIWYNTFTSFRRIAAPASLASPTGRTFDYESPSSLGLYTQSIIESRYQDIARDITRDMYDSIVELF